MKQTPAVNAALHEHSALVQKLVRRSATTIHPLIRELNNHLEVVLAASELGYYVSALDAQLLAKEVLDAIREELLRPPRPAQRPCSDLAGCGKMGVAS